MVSLGYGKFVRSDEITAIESIGEGRGPGRRTLVWVRGLPAPLVASRSEEAILEDMLRSPEEAKPKMQRSVLRALPWANRSS
jgi:hypothetical protein